ncbi:MAG TPA: Si-specific NAD(P)(+) transhydrogenase [Candidatus Dormibacteraeota bacterium]|nr:Si-specific NAD(P)(+) transhydrogenase [Candidatus Dormibacteraeota bacterium]
MESFDLIVIGSGPAGEKGAVQAASFGKRVALIERRGVLGGASANTGTVPSKTLRESALYFSGLRQRGLFDIDDSLREGLSVQGFMRRKDAVITAERLKIATSLAAHKIELISGTARFEDPHTINAVNSDGAPRYLRGEVILIATGSTANRPPEIPFDDKTFFDSDTILSMGRVPKSMIVVGAGVIGCEYASIFTAVGVAVTLVERRERLLPFLDREISERLREHLASLGLTILFQESPKTTERTASGVRMTLSSGKVVEAETTLFAGGRHGAVEGLGLERAGLGINQYGNIDVNDHFQTHVPHIYAAGNVIGFPSLASTSMEQGRVAMSHAFGFPFKQRLASQLPMGIYTIPEISAVGETVESCEVKKIRCEVGRAKYANNARGQILGDTSGLLKLIFRQDTRQLLGVQIMGESATELIHLGMAVLEAGGTIDTFIELVFNFPTLSEMYKYAAYDGLGNLAKHELREG